MLDLTEKCEAMRKMFEERIKKLEGEFESNKKLQSDINKHIEYKQTTMKGCLNRLEEEQQKFDNKQEEFALKIQKAENNVESVITLTNENMNKVSEFENKFEMIVSDKIDKAMSKQEKTMKEFTDKNETVSNSMMDMMKNLMKTMNKEVVANKDTTNNNNAELKRNICDESLPRKGADRKKNSIMNYEYSNNNNNSDSNDDDETVATSNTSSNRNNSYAGLFGNEDDEDEEEDDGMNIDYDEEGQRPDY